MKDGLGVEKLLCKRQLVCQTNKDRVIQEILCNISVLVELFAQSFDVTQRKRIRYSIQALESLLKIQGMNTHKISDQDYGDIMCFILKIMNSIL
ncbi:MAG: hypothetical protein ACTSR8_05785 [Promethearchaeota archaeon]